MRDGIALSKTGHPTVVFVHDCFERAAKAQAGALGMPDLKIYVFPQNRPGTPEAEEATKAEVAAREFPALLEHRH